VPVKKKTIDSIASKSTAESYMPLPKGYRAGKTKYIFITGSVISGIGKGIFTSSLGKLLVDRGLKVAPMKLEAYLNVDSGTLNPYRHGEVFVLDDGCETDMDLGSYERFLDMQLTGRSFVTSGMIYKNIIEKERKGGYLGRDVQFIPHVTGETKFVVRNLAAASKADVVLCEIGGTVGDYENMFAMESVRQMAYEEGRGNVCVINLTYVLEPESTGEFKSKAAQLGIKRLLELGISPDMLICRSNNPVPRKIKEKISLNSGVPMGNVFGLHNINDIYRIPLFMRKEGVDAKALEILGLGKSFRSKGNRKLEEWTRKNTIKGRKKVTIGIVGKYTGLVDAYISIIKALEHSAGVTSTPFEIKWIEATELEKRTNYATLMKGIDGLIVPGGFGARGVEGKIRAAKYVREKRIPFLGLCYGFQVAVIEFARNVCGMKDANSTEIEARTKSPVICILPEQDEIEELGGTMRLGGYDVVVDRGTTAYSLYKSGRVRERFRHRYNVNTAYIELLNSKGMVFSGRAPKKKIMQILELPKDRHPFFVASQFHPEFTSRPLKPNPLFLGFMKACRKRA
jgi:CTP synthase